jgi:hypothetical protein
MKSLYIKRPLAPACNDMLVKMMEPFDFEREVELHMTLIYSKRAVDWSLPVFQPMEDPLVIVPQDLAFDRFGPHLVLCMRSPEIEARHRALVAAGAQFDWPEFNAHISLGLDPHGAVQDYPDISGIDQLRFEGEVRGLANKPASKVQPPEPSDLEV